MKIRLHYREERPGPWTTSVVETGQIPGMGEFLAPAPVRVFRVVLTLHVLFDAEYDAEVFAELIDFEQVQMEALGEVVWGK
ncbi:MAG: hypothetical protein ACYSXF_00450 [Planctomycetota bacterium]|jgi:hypothetical protein